MKAFSNFHPLALFAYFLSVLGVTMFVFNPLYTALSLAGGIFFCCTLSGTVKTLKSVLKLLPFLILIAVFNPLFNHRGATPLFFINDNAVTLEALVYGGVMALMILAVILWFKAFNIIFDSEKVLFLFGKISPKISLVFSMALRFISDFISYFKEVLAVQKRIPNKSRLRLYISCFSSVVTYSLENAVDTSDSMSARGYGCGKPSAFSRFTFRLRDVALLCTVLLFTAAVLYAVIENSCGFTVYPEIILKVGASGVLSITAFGVLCFLPGIYEIKEAFKWRISASAI